MIHASVIIPTYNRSRMLELTLQSLEKQRNRDVIFEVIVVDDGSTDDTRETVDKYRASFKALQYLYQQHLGFRVAKARNMGVDAAVGAVILFVDSGMILQQDYIYEHYQMHRGSEDLVVIGNVYGFAADTDDKEFIRMVDFTNLQMTFEQLEHESKYADPRIESYKNFAYDIKKVPAPYYYFWTCNLSVRRNNIIECGKFDENFNSWGMEDVELGYKLFKKGLAFHINLNAKSIHYPHDSAIEAKEKLTSNRDKNNKLYFHQKYMSLESELLLTGAHDMFYNEALMEIRDKEEQRFDYNRVGDQCLLKLPPGEATLVVGAHNAGILRNMSDIKVLEHNAAYLNALKDKCGAGSVYHLLGAITPFRNKEFAHVLITDIWRIYPFDWAQRLFTEACRIGRIVYIVDRITVDHVTEISNDRALSDYWKDKGIPCHEVNRTKDGSGIQYIVLTDL